MTESSWIFLIGIFVAVISYFSKNFVFEPLLEFRRVRGKIQNRLKYHANIITNGEFPIDVIKPIREELRQLSCDLEERYYAVALAKWLPTFLRIPSDKDLSETASSLIFLSNSTGSAKHIDANYNTIESIKRKLSII